MSNFNHSQVSRVYPHQPQQMQYNRSQSQIIQQNQAFQIQPQYMQQQHQQTQQFAMIQQQQQGQQGQQQSQQQQSRIITVAKQQGSPNIKQLSALSGQQQQQTLQHELGTQLAIPSTDGFQFVSSVPQMIEPEPMNCIIPPTSELGGLYLGGLDAASNVELLKKHKIRAVLTTSIETPLNYSEEVIQFHESLQAHDKDNYDITEDFEQAINFIDKHRNYTSVLVHCYAGVSRSASCVIVYFMKVFKWPLEKCLWFLRQKRRMVRPNPGFMEKLVKFEEKLFGKSSLTNAKQTKAGKYFAAQKQLQQQQQQQQQATAAAQQQQQQTAQVQQQQQQQQQQTQQVKSPAQNQAQVNVQGKMSPQNTQRLSYNKSPQSHLQQQQVQYAQQQQQQQYQQQYQQQGQVYGQQYPQQRYAPQQMVPQQYQQQMMLQGYQSQ